MVEMCKCGHERLCHTDTYEKGHGHCIANVKATQTPCECIKFTYISSIHLSKSIDERVEIIKK